MSDLTVLGIFLACLLSTFALIRACGGLMPASAPGGTSPQAKGDRS